MSYEQTLNYLYQQLPMYQRIGPAAYKANLDNTLALADYLNHPEKKFKSIHIAGTNGKGSVAHMLASVLQEAGYKTGLATSPHLRDFRERIKINGHLIPEKEIIGFVNKHKAFFEKIKPSFFEMAMALTFDYFAKQHVDLAVVETGLGGRLDSSNIITPELSVITNIGLDHMHLLGDTLEKIAAEKAGIIKTHIPVVIGRTQYEVQHVFEDMAQKNSAPLIMAEKLFQIKSIESCVTNNADALKVCLMDHQRKEKEFTLDVCGTYQAENLVTVLAAIHTLNAYKGFTIDGQSVEEGVRNVKRNTGLLGRWQRISRSPDVICDAAHNEDGMAYVVRQLHSAPHERLHMVIGMVDDKERSGIMKLLPKNAVYYFCRPAVPRGLDEKILANEALSFGLSGKAYSSVPNALAAARNEAGSGDLIFVGGSTFVVAEVV